MHNAHDLPWTPDFDVYPVEHSISAAHVCGTGVEVRWDDARISRYHALFLRENSPDEATIHPLSREMLMSPLDIPADIRPRTVAVDASGALKVIWSHGNHVSRFHPGWLRAHAWFCQGDAVADNTDTPTLWAAEELITPPTFAGIPTLENEGAFLQFLTTLKEYGIARLENLPQRDGLLEDVVTRIGPIRESNFGRTYDLFVRDDPDSNAYTSSMLLQHMDMPTRETPHGLQFLYCRRNSTAGGEGVYVDGYRIAEDMRVEDQANFDTLSTVIWEFNNRAKTSDYRARGPIFGLAADGRLQEIRMTPWLRAPLKAPLAVQGRAYLAVRRLIERAQSPRYQLVFAYRAGDFVAFDNRRILHGRHGYQTASGTRHIQGAYADRDDLDSRIRTLKRKFSQEPAPDRLLSEATPVAVPN